VRRVRLEFFSHFAHQRGAPARAARAVTCLVNAQAKSTLRLAERELADLKLQIGDRALACAEGKPGARESLAALHQKDHTVMFEIEHHPRLASWRSGATKEAIVAWKAPFKP